MATGKVNVEFDWTLTEFGQLAVSSVIEFMTIVGQLKLPLTVFIAAVAAPVSVVSAAARAASLASASWAIWAITMATMSTINKTTGMKTNSPATVSTIAPPRLALFLLVTFLAR